LRGATAALRLGMARKIHVTVKPRAKKPEITKVSDGEYRVLVRAAAQDGKANLALIELLADYFKVPKSTIKILRGQWSHHKQIEIGD
jgi:uncharacterized protein (TIGR00251 family)